jgi:hypothetical protein
MDHPTDEPLRDEDIVTISGGAGGEEPTATDTDGTDSGDDVDGTDTGDTADGTDTGDA